LPVRSAHAAKISFRHGKYSFSMSGSSALVGRSLHSQSKVAVYLFVEQHRTRDAAREIQDVT